MIAEGTTLAICAAVYLYLRRNFESWPPLRTPPPDLLIPTISVIALVASVGIAVMMDRAAHAFDIARTRFWLLIGSAFDVILLTLRALEFNSLNTRWDNDAYGSIVWFTIGFHSTLLLLVFIEDLFIAGTFVKGPLEEKHFSDASDSAFYWYFVVAAWIPLYVLLYLGPRFM
jgi:heme/copper-type cytochrome/quinol oxidase subunit 3